MRTTRQSNVLISSSSSTPSLVIVFWLYPDNLCFDTYRSASTYARASFDLILRRTSIRTSTSSAASQLRTRTISTSVCSGSTVQPERHRTGIAFERRGLIPHRQRTWAEFSQWLVKLYIVRLELSSVGLESER